MRARLAIAAFAALSLGAAPAPPAPGQSVAFVGCPVIRDTEPVPCWLAEHEGRLYYLGIQADASAAFYPPQLGHQTLVEGVVTDRRLCGGIVLEPVRASVLKPLAPHCDRVLKAQGHRIEHAERGPGPSTVPPRPRPPAVLPPPPPPYGPKTTTVWFDFDRDHIFLRSAFPLREIATYAKAANARRVTVTGYRGAVGLTDGGVMTEEAAIARVRAEKVAEFIRELGAPAVEVLWDDRPRGGDGLRDWEERRVTVEVAP
ncbi:hypothetical protein ACFODL_04800 [Phenylobacterium terrae]|uniref:OmpA-like domain-containing protein n=1 Tax=Phenylobacterium terrae TaxID=2665495 RepID=A0ABW4MYB0_9CAUL